MWVGVQFQADRIALSPSNRWPPPLSNLDMLTTRLAQTVINSLLRSSTTTRYEQCKLKLLRKARRWLVQHGDPLISCSFDGVDLLMPLSHELPFYRKSLPDYGTNLGRIVRHVQGKYPDLAFIDIGANIGDTLATVRRFVRLPVLGIEGDDCFFAVLQLNAPRLGPDVFLEKSFISHRSGLFPGSVERQSGTARLIRSTENSGDDLKVKTLSGVLAGHASFRGAKMLKVDADGFDISILRSELELLGRMRPVLFFEYDPYLFPQNEEDGFEIFGNLQSAGYRQAIFYENNGDYLLTAELSQVNLLEDLHHFYEGRRSNRYCDICAFHSDDLDLCTDVRLAEIDYFRRLRLENGPP